MKNQNIINFYISANKLKEVIRTGWKEVKISAKRIESVAEHIYGCLTLTIALKSEYHLEIDINKVFFMTILKELEKIDLEKEYIPTNKLSKEQRQAKALEKIREITKNLTNQEELMTLVKEFQEGITKEAKFTNCVSKIESDLQAKIYDLKGEFTLENALEDIKNFDTDLQQKILPNIKNASDGWLEYDKKYYKEDELFKNLAKDIQELENLE